MAYCYDRRLLLVLDDLEAILSSSNSANRYLEGYQEYRELLARFATESHNSCLLLLSREKPIEIDSWKGDRVRLHRLRNLDAEAARQILIARGLRGKAKDLEELSGRYSNPKMLQLVAEEFLQATDGKVPEICSEAFLMINDAIADFLDRQFQRLSFQEKSVLYWLAIRRNTATIEQLRSD
jgi:hypothetical protein